MKPRTKRTISLLTSVLFLVSALAIYVNLVQPAYQDVQRLRGTLQAKTNLLARQKTIISQVQNLLAQFKSATQLQETVSLALPNNEASSALFHQIQAIARASNLTLDSIAFNLLSLKSGKLGTIQTTLRLSGNYAGIKTFLNAIETNVRVMDLVNLKLEQSTKPNQDLYGYTVALNAYYQQ